MKKIVFLSGKRGGYEAMRPLMKLLSKSKIFDFKIILTDQHFEQDFGNTFKLVLNDFKKKEIISIKFNSNTKDTNFERTLNLIDYSKKFTRVIKKLSPDLFILYGDRSEVAISSLILFSLRVPIIHLQGGDISGSLDNTYRHVISKFSNYHLVSNLNSRNNLIKMGEKKKFIKVVGDHHLDNLKKKQFYSEQYILNKYKIKKKYCIVLQHSETTQSDDSKMQMLKTLKALKYYNIEKIVIYPCTDPGWKGIIEAINSYKNYENFKIFKNIEGKYFWSLLKYSSFIIGNSSSGIIESQFLKIPAINVGRRQNKRLKNKNIVSTKHNVKQIKNAIKKVLNSNRKDLLKIKSIYGNGNANIKTFNIIKKLCHTRIETTKSFNFEK
jgi:UDP-hydrolysing UDP-N-acetyl-D-glucosamine 2-epimerase